LFFEVLRRDQERTNARFEGVLDKELPLEQVQTRIRDLYAALYDDGNSFMTWTEGRMLSARDPKFRARLSTLIAQRRDFAVKLIEYVYKRAGATASLPLDALAMGLISLTEGVRLLMASCPQEMPRDVAESILKHFVDSATLQRVAAGIGTGPVSGR
jgi:hypothetical protein